MHLQSIASDSLNAGMMEYREQREIKAVEKATKVAREAYVGIPIFHQLQINFQR